MTETQNQPNNEESVVIIGTRRDDVLYGSLGHNIFYGGLGNDTFIVNNRNDQIVERYGEGTDTVYTHTTYTLPNYVENLTMTGHDNIFGFGNNSDNVLIGNSGNNRLSAGRGNDVLYGGAGNDLLLAGDDDDKLYGGDGNDILRGDHGNDYLEGNEGDDVLDGGIGADVMRGGNGNDTYYVDSPNDVVIEEANGGIDTVYTGMTYRLPTHVENLTLTGSGNYFGFGNHSDNVLIGNSGNNRLIGGRGNDVLRGEAGYDLLLADDGDDKLYGGTGNDILRGDAGNDYLDGGEGNDTLEGGSGDDTHVFRRGSGHDVISDNLGHNCIHFEGLSAKDISLTTRPSASNPALKDWVFTIRETGETLTLKEQHKTYSSVSKYKFADKETDDLGRIKSFNTDNLQLTSREQRLTHNANTPDKVKGQDHAGHLIGDRFGGSPKLENLVSQHERVNLSEYKRMENTWENAIKSGKRVKIQMSIEYAMGTSRPTRFVGYYWIDGQHMRINISNL